jgi:hypothetical protein
MISGHLRVSVLAPIAVALLAPAVAMAPLNAQSARECHSATAARGDESGCYLLSETLVRSASKGGGNTSVSELAPPPESTVEINAEDAGTKADKSRSNQLTIIGWIACVYLFAKGLEFAISPAFRGRQESREGQTNVAALVAATGICIAAVVFFVLLTLQARQVPTPPKTYNSLADCLHDAQTADQIRECGSKHYNQL